MPDSVSAAVDAARVDLVARGGNLTAAVEKKLLEMAGPQGDVTSAVKATVEVVLAEIRGGNLTAIADAARVNLVASRGAAGHVALTACLVYIWLALLIDIVLGVLWSLPLARKGSDNNLKQRLSLARIGVDLCMCHEAMWSHGDLQVSALRELLADRVPGIGGNHWRDPQKTLVELVLPGNHDNACCFFALDLGSGDTAKGYRRLIICPRGSYTSKDWLADFEFAFDQPPWVESLVEWIQNERRTRDHLILSGGSVLGARKWTQLERQVCQLSQIRAHRGFGDWYMKFRYSLWEVIDHWSALHGAFDEVLFCGHSLGAATATLAALDFALTLEVRSATGVHLSQAPPIANPDDGKHDMASQAAPNDISRPTDKPMPVMKVVTFGSPRVGNLEFCRAFNARYASSALLQCQLDHDVVSFLPHMWVGLVCKKTLWAAFGVQLLMRYFMLDFCRRFTLSANLGSSELTVDVRKIEQLWMWFAAVEAFVLILLFLFPELGTVLWHVVGADSFCHVGRGSDSMLLIFETGEAMFGMSRIVVHCHSFQWILGVLQGGRSFTQHYLARYKSSIERACVSARSGRSWSRQSLKALTVITMLVVGGGIYYPVVTDTWFRVAELGVR